MDLINSTALYESSAKNLPDGEKDRLRVSGKELVIGEDYDRIDATYPTSKTERYTYTLNSNIVLELEVTYVTSSKKDVESVVVL